VALDLPGHGFSGSPVTTLTPEALFGGLHAAFDQLLGEPTILLGTSPGGRALPPLRRRAAGACPRTRARVARRRSRERRRMARPRRRVQDRVRERGAATARASLPPRPLVHAC